MTDKEKKSKIADILMDFQEEYSNEVVNRPMLASLYAGNILSFIDSLQKEPVNEDLEEAAKRYATEGDEISGLYIIDEEADAFKAGAKWQKENLWKPADGNDLPIFDREVIVFTQPYPLEGTEYAVSFAHRPNPDGWDGKSLTSGKVEHYTPKTYDKGGWNQSDVKWWIDCNMDSIFKRNNENSKINKR